MQGHKKSVAELGIESRSPHFQSSALSTRLYCHSAEAGREGELAAAGAESSASV